jgi:hypothetical protein
VHPDKCSCKTCMGGRVALWKAFAGRPIHDIEFDILFTGMFSSHMFSVPLRKKMGDLNVVEDGVFGWGT